MVEIKKKTAPEKPAIQADTATPESRASKGKHEEHHAHRRPHDDRTHVISPPSGGSSYLNPGAIRIGR